MEEGAQLDNYYLRHPEPVQGCLLALKDLILRSGKGVTQQRRFQIPFFYYKGMRMAYLWVNRKKLQLGFVEDIRLSQETGSAARKDRYESMIIDANADLPVDEILGKLGDIRQKIDEHG